ncbi:MAG: SCO1664 family protein [Acidimicrobiia bacterium]
MPALELEPDDARELLADGELSIVGRVAWSSNATFLATVTVDGVDVLVVYKPRRGERPLWDFPDGTLYRRELAAYEVSEALGWGIVPVTIAREGPLGPGAVQLFVDHDPEDHYFELLADHADRLRQFAVFDVIVNNADRKAGHCLRSRADGAIVGIDHGLTFSAAWKLRTVIWDFAGERVPAAAADDLCRLADAVDGPFGERLSSLLSPIEADALQQRTRALVRAGRLPEPDAGYHSMPWPLV